MIGRVATKISNFFTYDDQLSKYSHQKRSVNAISPATPIKPNTIINNIDHKTIIGTCQSLKKMKIDISNQYNEEDNHQLNVVVDIDEMHQINSNKVYDASLLPLSSSSSYNQSPLFSSGSVSDDEVFEDQNTNNIEENSTSFADIIPLLTTSPTFVSVETQTVLKNTLDAFTQTAYDIYIPIETYIVTSTTNAEDIVTDEDIIKYLTQKKRKES